MLDVKGFKKQKTPAYINHMLTSAFTAKENILEKKISILKEVADIIVSTGNLDAITNLVLDLALQYTTAKTGSILLLDDKQELTVKAARGTDNALMAALRLKIVENICEKVALERKPLFVKDAEHDKRIFEMEIDEYKTKSFICCPILIKDKLLGVINISDKIDGTSFTEDELDLISILANQAAIAIENVRLTSELRSKTVELDETNNGLIEADRSRSEFVARMSHELRTPLNSIKGAIYYLKEKTGGPEIEQTEFIKIISEETNKLINLLEGLLDFSRFDKERYLLKKRVFNLNNVIEDVIAAKTVKKLLKDRRLSVSPMLAGQLPDITGDRTRIFQLFINLIEGTTKYSTAGDVIELRTFDVDTGVEVELIIKGKKVPDKELSFIFDSRVLWSWIDAPYHNNLKFYLARKVVELHKGTISAQNTSRGFSIKIIIPKNPKEQRDVETNELMNLFLSFAAKSMGMNICSLMLTDELTGDLTIKGAYGLDEEIIRRTRLNIGEKIAGLVAIEKRPMLIEDIEKDPHVGKMNNAKYNTNSLLSLPIFIRDDVIGVLNLNNKENGEPLNIKDFYLARAIASRISYILEKLYMGDLKEKDYKKITKGMDTLLTAEEKYIKRNGEIRDLVFKIMKNLEHSEDEIGLALYASAVYDLGLTQIDESILKKQQGLTSLEEKIIKTHPLSGAGLIEHVEHSDMVKKIILSHHERYDGSGYPEGLKGENIPLISRVLAVIDTYTAMTTDKPYRKAIGKEAAIEHIKSRAVIQFDPKIVDAFNEVVN